MQYPVRTGPVQNDQSRFSIEMVQGHSPNRPRIFLGPQIRQPDYDLWVSKVPILILVSGVYQSPGEV